MSNLPPPFLSRKRLKLNALSLFLCASSAYASDVTVNNITYSTNDDSLTAAVTAYSGEDPEVSILPSVTIDGQQYSVTSIGDFVFYDKSSLRKVIVPEPVTELGERSFSHCGNLTDISLPESLQIIGESALDGCRNLRELEIPSSVTSIGYLAFWCCAFESITIPARVTEIGDRAFEGCSRLSYITLLCETPPTIDESTFPWDILERATIQVPKGCIDAYRNAWPWSDFPNITDSVTNVTIDGIRYFISSDDKTAIAAGRVGVITEAYIPEAVTVDGVEYAVTSIGAYAFYESDQLETVEIRAAVGEIPERAFSHCHALTTVTLPDGLLRIGNSAFDECPALVKADIPETVTEIGELAFWRTGFTEITIPESVTRIGGRAYGESPDIEKIIVHAPEPPRIEYNTFVELDKESCTIYVPVGSVDAYRDAEYWNEFENITDGVHSTQNGKITIDGIRYAVNADGETARVLGREGRITEANILPAVTINEVEYRVNSIANRAFESCEGLVSAVIPESVTSIGTYAFYESDQLETVEIRAAVSEIPERAFSHCHALATVTLPDGLLRIGDSAFDECPALVKADIPETVTEIRELAFWRTGFTEITIPESVTRIGGRAYGESYDIEKINALSTVPPAIEYNTFTGLDKDGCVLQVPVGSMDTYSKAEYWREFNLLTDGTTTVNPGRVTIDGIKYAVTDFEEHTAAVVACTSRINNAEILSTVTIDDEEYAVTAIAQDAFIYQELYSVTIPEGIKSISWGAFRHTRLSEVFIPASVEYIDERVFDNCYDLEKITVDENNACYASNEEGVLMNKDLTVLVSYPAGRPGDTYRTPAHVTQIAPYAFADNSNLIEIQVNDGVTVIEHRAFQGCDNLERVILPEGITELSDCLFEGCSELTYVHIPETVRKINYGAFAWCTSFTSVTLPSQLEKIGHWVFSFNLVDITLLNPVPPVIDTWAFYPSDFQWHNAIVKVPEGCAETYRQDPEWKVFLNITDGVSVPDMTRVNIDGVEYGIDPNEPGVATVTWHSTDIEAANIRPSVAIGGVEYPVTSIWDYAFINSWLYNCETLASVVIPNSIDKIGAGAFSDCNEIRFVHSLNPVPPAAADDWCFADNVYEDAVLYVPVGSVEAYREALMWGRFQTIVERGSDLDELADATYGDGPVLLSAVNAAGETLTYESSNPDVATVSADNVLSFVGAGETQIVATSETGEQQEHTLTVGKASLTVMPRNVAINAGDELPRFELTAFGLKHNDRLEDLDELPQASCDIADTNTPGSYAIRLTGGNDRNYDLTLHDGTLTINDKPSSLDEITANGNDDIIYDMQGRRLNSANRRGIYIVNGRKTVLKP